MLGTTTIGNAQADAFFGRTPEPQGPMRH